MGGHRCGRVSGHPRRWRDRRPWAADSRCQLDDHGVAGLVFSITLVALSLISSQYSSRVIRDFMRDRVNQWVLGVFLGSSSGHINTEAG